VSTKGGIKPKWTSNGGELVFFSDGFVTSVPVQTTATTFSPGNPTRLFDTKYFPGNAERTYDVTRDGQKFLMVKDQTLAVLALASDGTQVPINMTVVLNWTEELKAPLPQR
jgi:hypothetical protein